MAAQRRSGRSRFSLFILLLLSATLLTLDARNFQPVEQLKDGIAAMVSPFRSLGNAAFSPIGNAWENVSSSDDLEAENIQLRREIQQLLAEQIEASGAAEELADIKEQLRLPVSAEYEALIAEVTAGSISNFDEFVLEINRGAADGVVEGMPVVSIGGLVGRIEDTGQRNARVRLISDTGVSLGVQLVRSEEVGIMSGKGANEPLEVSKGSIRVNADVKIGDVVVTSGGDRSLYPPNLPVGMVVDIEVDQGNLQQILFVEPSASLDRIEFVTVLLFDPAAGDAQGTAQADLAEPGRA